MNILFWQFEQINYNPIIQVTNDFNSFFKREGF